ncbi:MobC family plasmid mobilization relaxosome protein [Paraburkholderia sp. Ac-20342]|uniref:plasmid mobilization relaxosome protein MobC n=1 Tax=Paraburkholderia sp. Ac-20342 TaxID=2703889 RepID=UPI0019808207|nr:plasmid mobilization relaxosome protein MobC [Paraburkholderia sp. Ac-20342]MBN3848723.1 MobC family plasmid mobilization relaxosome protein [Paraburkholderia sp. Ac-20342]
MNHIPFSAGRLDQRIEFRLSAQHALLLARHCDRIGMRQSELLRRLVEREIGIEPVDPARSTLDPRDDDTETPEYRRSRVELSLTDAELAALDAHAAAAGYTSRSRFIVSTIRSALSGTPQLLADDLDALRSANVELAAVGRNLNQIARSLNAHRSVHMTAIQAAVGDVATAVKTLNRTIGDLLASPRRRWWMRERS